MSDQNKTEKKPLPHSVDKKTLLAMYINQMPEQTIKSSINLIILDNRKNLQSYKGKSVRQIIGTQKVWHQELAEFVATYGMPRGYRRTDESE